MFDEKKWSIARVTERTEWDPGLFTVRLDAKRDFHAGQFTKLGLGVDGDPVSRAYSIASAPGEPLDFYIVEVDGGALSPRLCALRQGDEVWVQDRCVGGFTLEKVPDGRDIWLIATGTGLAPYISMLRQGTIFERFENIIVVQGARYARQLGHDAELKSWANRGAIKLLSTITREDAPGCIRGRVTNLYDDGILEEAAGLAMHKDTTHVMMCGNPDMIKDMTARFKEQREMLLHTPRRHGNVHVERYW